MAILMPINGAVLQWALDERHLTAEQLAERLSVEPAVVRRWLTQETKPNKGQLAALTRFLHVPASTFFLPERPPETSGTVEFRRHPGASVDTIPDETAAAIATARTVLRVGTWLDERGEDSDKIPSVPRAYSNEPPEQVGQRLRDWLGWTVEEQTKADATDYTAAKSMRAALQRQSVLVLHLTMDEVTRGFSLHEAESTLIAINTRDHVRARMFSYAHELAHLALRDDSVCLTRSDSGIEGFCNRVAAALLMPAAAYRDFVLRRVRGPVGNRDHVVSIRNHFKVSLQAAAIRAETLDLAAEGLWDSIDGGIERRQSGGTYVPGNERTRPRIRVDQLGSGFVNALIDAQDSGLLRRSQVLDLLRLSERELGSAREFAASEGGL